MSDEKKQSHNDDYIQNYQNESKAYNLYSKGKSIEDDSPKKAKKEYLAALVAFDEEIAGNKYPEDRHDISALQYQYRGLVKANIIAINRIIYESEEKARINKSLDFLDQARMARKGTSECYYFKSAIADFKQWCILEPDNYTAHFYLGYVYYADGNYELAKNHLKLLKLLGQMMRK